jgi:hypothetical protein
MDSSSRHYVHLWSETGPIAGGTAQSTSETSRGWQNVLFPKPVPIIANTTYIVSYFMPGGYFPVDRSDWTTNTLNAMTNGFVNFPLQALADGEERGNGVFAYGSSSSPPNQSFRASNYWVDVLFSATP